MAVRSRRNVSNSFKRSGEAAISFFFHTKTSPPPRFSFRLRLPSTMYVGDASKRNPALATGLKSAAHRVARKVHSHKVESRSGETRPQTTARKSSFVADLIPA